MDFSILPLDIIIRGILPKISSKDMLALSMTCERNYQACKVRFNQLLLLKRPLLKFLYRKYIRKQKQNPCRILPKFSIINRLISKEPPYKEEVDLFLLGDLNISSPTTFEPDVMWLKNKRDMKTYEVTLEEGVHDLNKIIFDIGFNDRYKPLKLELRDNRMVSEDERLSCFDKNYIDMLMPFLLTRYVAWKYNVIENINVISKSQLGKKPYLKINYNYHNLNFLFKNGFQLNLDWLKLSRVELCCKEQTTLRFKLFYSDEICPDKSYKLLPDDKNSLVHLKYNQGVLMTSC